MPENVVTLNEKITFDHFFRESLLLEIFFKEEMFDLKFIFKEHSAKLFFNKDHSDVFLRKLADIERASIVLIQNFFNCDRIFFGYFFKLETGLLKREAIWAMKTD